MRTDQATPVRLVDYRPPDFLIDIVELDIRLDRSKTEVHARLSLRRNPAGRPDAPLVLDGDGLVLHHLAIDGEALGANAFVANAESLTIAEAPQQPFDLTIVTIVDPTANTQLMGLYRSGSAYCTQCEAEGFRRITYFLDRPDVLSVYTTRIEADRDEAPVLLGNGNRVASEMIDGTNRHYAVWHDPHPKPCYLFALVGGDLGAIHDTFATLSGRSVALGIYVEHGKELRAAYAMDSLQRAMAWDERAFGREYDLDVFNIVAVSDFNMGAMENKGLNIFNDKYVLALAETATDLDYAHIEAVIAHEYFHNWTGNRITCRDWFQLCLKEGLTVYRDQEFSSDQRSRAVKRIADVRTLRASQFPEDAGPLAHNVRPESYLEINNFYTPTVYEKGAEIIRMLSLLIGAEHFRRGMDLYFERCDGMAATVEDFIACFAEVSHRDLSQFMCWYTQAGTPLVRLRGTYNSDARTYSLDISQTIAPTPGQNHKAPAVLPLALGLLGAAGKAVKLHTAAADQAAGASEHETASGLFEIATGERQIIFHGIDEPPVLSAFRGFSAPVRIDSNVSDAELLVLLRYDSDTFNRWQAAQTFATKLLIHAVKILRAGEKIPPWNRAFIEALGALVTTTSQDHAFVAQTLTLPSESDLAREIGKDVDPNSIHQARQALRAEIGQVLMADLSALYERLSEQQKYVPDAAGSGRRALRHAALDFLVAGDCRKGAEIALHQFDAADNMTDQIGALSILSHTQGDVREQALERFFRQHGNDALVVDKWFGLQAMIPESGTLDRIRRLMQHHAFSIANPNRVRALVGSFATANPTQFNAPDGSGYTFLREVVATLDRRNPQVAARLTGAFKSWRSLEPGRQAQAQRALRELAVLPELSADVGDIVARSLA